MTEILDDGTTLIHVHLTTLQCSDLKKSSDLSFKVKHNLTLIELEDAPKHCHVPYNVWLRFIVYNVEVHGCTWTISSLRMRWKLSWLT